MELQSKGEMITDEQEIKEMQKLWAHTLSQDLDSLIFKLNLSGFNARHFLLEKINEMDRQSIQLQKQNQKQNQGGQHAH